MRRKTIFIKIGDIDIHPKAIICDGAIIGKPFRKLLDGSQEGLEKTIIGKDSYIGYYATVGAGSLIEPGTIIDDHCIVESRVKIGKCSLVSYRSQICNDVQIGDHCVIGGFIAERTIIGNKCRIFGNIIHLQHNPLLGWDDDEAIEESPIVKDNAFIGFNAVVAGKVTIGFKAFVCANATITNDVPDLHIASGINKVVHFSKWPGRLRFSPFFL
jgi:acetyltransferase-like isoleucine patch superfamily enzyme